MQKMYTVALCDILGFSDHVKNYRLDMVVAQTMGYLRKSLHHSLNRTAWPDNAPSLDEINQNLSVGVAWFSDTILLFTREDEDDNLQKLLQTVKWLLFETMIEGTTRLRVGIAYGEASIDPKNAMYVGKPIIRAYQLEQSQQWSGAALTSLALNRVPEDYRDGKFVDWPILHYKVPLKSNLSFQTLAVNWTHGLHEERFFDWAPRSNDPSIVEKMKNTKQFHLDVCDQCRSRVDGPGK